MDFVFETQCDEMVDYRPTDADWAEYGEWLDGELVMEEKLKEIEKAWAENNHHKLIFEWVKNGRLSILEFREVIDLVSTLDENESRKCWG